MTPTKQPFKVRTGRIITSRHSKSLLLASGRRSSSHRVREPHHSEGLIVRLVLLPRPLGEFARNVKSTEPPISAQSGIPILASAAIHSMSRTQDGIEHFSFLTNYLNYGIFI